MTNSRIGNSFFKKADTKRLESIDLLRGTVMIIMVLDHTRDYFHNSTFLYNPEDLAHTNTLLFFTRWITHYCAPVFVFLAGLSAYLYGSRKSKKELSFFLLTRGIWLVLVELFVISLFRTFNPTYQYLNLQVIWAIGISMIVLSALIYLKWRIILFIGLLLIAAHNMLDTVHILGGGMLSFLWALLHDPGYFTFGHFSVRVHYPLLPWIGILAIGYCFGNFYASDYKPEKRKKILFWLGCSSIVFFIVLRSGNWYGDPSHWTAQKTVVFSVLSFLNVTKYPPSFLYILITLGPALIFLALTEKPLNAFAGKIAVFGRVPMFYYLAHILLIHILATIGAIIQGYKLTDMILTTSVMKAPSLKGYGFDLVVVYIIWVAIIFILYPFCKWFDRYKRRHQSTKWLSYL